MSAALEGAGQLHVPAVLSGIAAAPPQVDPHTPAEAEAAAASVDVQVELTLLEQGLAPADSLTPRRDGPLYASLVGELVGRRHPAYATKRCIDVLLAAILLGLLAPVLVLVAVAIKLTSRGPVFYRQSRLKQHGERFTLLKFRTMRLGAEDLLDEVSHLNIANGPLFKSPRDPRITRVGRLLRRTYLDEVPQFINVLRGDMSLVGPRPCLPTEARHMPATFVVRFMVPQGMTGPWQVNGHHFVPVDEQIELERRYVEKWSLLADLAILLRTLPLVVRGTGL